MKLELRKYYADGFQDDGAQMKTVFLEGTLVSDDGSRRYTLGRVFFDPDALDGIFGADLPTLELDGFTS